jgi:hypothetical protein
VLVTPDNCNASYAGTAVYKAAPNLMKQEIYFAIQTFFGAVKKHGLLQAPTFPARGRSKTRLAFVAAGLHRRL